MGKRRKRLEKGIESIEKQIEFHEEKRNSAVESGKKELAGYYEKEIERMKDRKKNREEKLRRK